MRVLALATLVTSALLIAVAPSEGRYVGPQDSVKADMKSGRFPLTKDGMFGPYAPKGEGQNLRSQPDQSKGYLTQAERHVPSCQTCTKTVDDKPTEGPYVMANSEDIPNPGMQGTPSEVTAFNKWLSGQSGKSNSIAYSPNLGGIANGGFFDEIGSGELALANLNREEILMLNSAGGRGTGGGGG